MKFKVSIDIKNAALRDEHDDGSHLHLAELLREVAQQVEDGYTSGYPRDYNGNTVGEWKFTGKD